MDPWRKQLHERFLGSAPSASFLPSAAASLEIAFGQIRSELTYVLELGRAHRMPITGMLNGDEIWLGLGGRQVRFAIDRKGAGIVATSEGHEPLRIAQKQGEGGFVDATGATVDVTAFVRAAIDELVAQHHAARAPKDDAK